jgi:phage N-6-adenine-methyltransferase
MGNFDKNRFKSTNQEWETPDSIYLPLDNEFHFTLDVAASDINTKCPKYFSEDNDGLSASWWKEVCWMNPPYNQVGKWIKKAYEEYQSHGATVVCLVQSRTNTNWWHDYCMKGEVRFVRGRPKFKGCVHGLPQPLAIVIFKQVELSI